MKLRLLLTEECNRSCKGCCNKGWDLSSIPVCISYEGFEEILITGGEPLIKPGLLFATIINIRMVTDTPIYIYTAYREDPARLWRFLSLVDGITLTLHTKKDVAAFKELNDMVIRYLPAGSKSLRLNVFKGIELTGIDTSRWIVKKDMVWIKDCPLPENEEFMRVKQ